MAEQTYHEAMKKGWLKRKKDPEKFREMQRLSVKARKRNKKLSPDEDLHDTGNMLV